MPTTYKAKYLAGFIITYNRVNLLPSTVEKILAQSFPPEKLLIVDNSEGTETEEWVKTVPHLPLQYYRVGYNSGPAGGAAIGLQKLAEEGYEWIYWGDDNDPPHFPNTFEVLHQLIHRNKHLKLGSVGAVGQYFNKRTGLFKRVTDTELQKSKNNTFYAGSIAGGQSKWVLGKAVLAGATTNKELFFSFEDLDFDIQLKKLGYHLLVDAHHFLEHRKLHGRLGKISKNKNSLQQGLQREYYSSRNLATIFMANTYYMACVVLLLRQLMKLTKVLCKNPTDGKGLAKVLWLSWLHTFSKTLGRQVL